MQETHERFFHVAETLSVGATLRRPAWWRDRLLKPGCCPYADPVKVRANWDSMYSKPASSALADHRLSIRGMCLDRNQGGGENSVAPGGWGHLPDEILPPQIKSPVSKTPHTNHEPMVRSSRR